MSLLLKRMDSWLWGVQSEQSKKYSSPEWFGILRCSLLQCSNLFLWADLNIQASRYHNTCLLWLRQDNEVYRIYVSFRQNCPEVIPSFMRRFLYFSLFPLSHVFTGLLWRLTEHKMHWLCLIHSMYILCLGLFSSW